MSFWQTPKVMYSDFQSGIETQSASATLSKSGAIRDMLSWSVPEFTYSIFRKKNKNGFMLLFAYSQKYLVSLECPLAFQNRRVRVCRPGALRVEKSLNVLTMFRVTWTGDQRACIFESCLGVLCLEQLPGSRAFPGYSQNSKLHTGCLLGDYKMAVYVRISRDPEVEELSTSHQRNGLLESKPSTTTTCAPGGWNGSVLNQVLKCNIDLGIFVPSL